MKDRYAPHYWFVAYTRPRCEKKFSKFCTGEGLNYKLPLYGSVKSYRGKTLIFQKPLFPSYVFLQLQTPECARVRQNRYVVRLLQPLDQSEFQAQLADILKALESQREVRLAPSIRDGQRVTLKSGPLQGLEGIVVRRDGTTEVLMKLDFIGQAASVRVTVDELELS